MVSPSTPVPMTKSMSRRRLASSTAPDSSNGVGVMLKMPCTCPPRRVLVDGYGRARMMPPSTGTIAPLTYEAAGESRKAATRPISVGAAVATERDAGLGPALHVLDA